MSRAEAAVRRVTHEWVLACNTKHLDDLLDLYVPDALVLRSNCPADPRRGGGARVFLWRLRRRIGRSGNRASASGSRRRARLRSGTVQSFDSQRDRQAPRRTRQVFVGMCAADNGEWKLAADCWSSDLTLNTLESDVPQSAGVKTIPAAQELMTGWRAGSRYRLTPSFARSARNCSNFPISMVSIPSLAAHSRFSARSSIKQHCSAGICVVSSASR